MGEKKKKKERRDRGRGRTHGSRGKRGKEMSDQEVCRNVKLRKNFVNSGPSSYPNNKKMAAHLKPKMPELVSSLRGRNGLVKKG